MSSQTVNVDAFNAATANNSQFGSLVDTFNQSQTMVSMLNAFTSANVNSATGQSNNQLVWGASGAGTTTNWNSQGGLTISIDPAMVNGLNSDQISVLVAHELGHATQSGEMYNDPSYINDSPLDDAFNGNNAEGVASVASYNVASELNQYNITNHINIHLYANNNPATDLAIENAPTTYKDPNTGLTVQYATQGYANTDAAFEQVALHEIGHALGLADTDVAGSIMNAVLGSGNSDLSAADIANVQKLYAGTSSNSSAASASQVHQLVQAMSTFDAGEQGIDLNPMAELHLQKEHLLASSLSMSHVRAA